MSQGHLRDLRRSRAGPSRLREGRLAGVCSGRGVAGRRRYLALGPRRALPGWVWRWLCHLLVGFLTQDLGFRSDLFGGKRQKGACHLVNGFHTILRGQRR